MTADRSDRPHLDQVNLVVRDMEATVEFYRRLGVDVPDGDQQWGPHHRSARLPGGIDLDFDSTAFASKWSQGWPTGSTRPVIGFRLPSREAVDAAYDDLTAAGYTGQQPPYDAFWGSRYAIVEDPDGNPVGLMSPREAGRQTAPPDPSSS